MKTNFMQTINLSKEERIKMYMKLTKKELAEMLTERDEIEDSYKKDYFPLDCRPSICKTWKDCTNPFQDCINCPLRYKSGDRDYVVESTFHIKDKPMEGIWY